MCKKPLEKRPNIRDMRPFWKSAIMQRQKHMKIPHFGSKIKIPKKHVKIHSTNHLQLFCAKNHSKKDQIFETWDHFENRPSCKGKSTCKILTLSQKLKLQNTCQNLFYKSCRDVLCKKPHEKRPNIRKNEIILKIGHHAKAIAHAKCSLSVKN